MNRHLVLVGLPGSGKTTAGQHVARLLNAAFSDIDDLVSQATGKTISALFAEEGETVFRRLERAAMAGALSAPPHVIAPGAGWAAQPGNLETATGALIVYLQVTPEVVASRLSGDSTRPLLVGKDALGALRDMLVRREPWYQKAHATVDASRAPHLVAQELVRLA